MRSAFPARTPKLQLAAEQPSTGGCLLPLKTNKQTNKQKTHPRAKEKSQQDDRRDELMFRIKPHKCQRYLEGSEKTLLTPGLTRD